jgi:glutaredoxin
MVDITSPNGKDKAKVVVYALSTCGWCARTKKFLEEQGIDHSVIDVDLLSDTESTQAKRDMLRWNPRMSFPTVVVNDEIAIIGHDTNKVLEALK